MDLLSRVGWTELQEGKVSHFLQDSESRLLTWLKLKNGSLWLIDDSYSASQSIVPQSDRQHCPWGRTFFAGPPPEVCRPKFPRKRGIPDTLFARHLKHFSPSRYDAAKSWSSRHFEVRRSVLDRPRKATPILSSLDPYSGSFIQLGPSRRMLPPIIPSVLFEEDMAALAAFNYEAQVEVNPAKPKSVLTRFRISISRFAYTCGLRRLRVIEVHN